MVAGFQFSADMMVRQTCRCQTNYYTALETLSYHTYLTLLVNVGVVNQGPEADLGRLEGIFCWEDEIYQEGSLKR